MKSTIPFILSTILFLSAGCDNANDPFMGVKPDMDEDLHEFGRPASWNATRATIADTGFVAHAGPSLYTDKENEEWDYYTIDIEFPHNDGSYVFFERNFEIQEISPDLLLTDVKKLFTYDEETRLVTFEIGDITERYTLPRK